MYNIKLINFIELELVKIICCHIIIISTLVWNFTLGIWFLEYLYFVKKKLKWIKECVRTFH